MSSRSFCRAALVLAWCAGLAAEDISGTLYDPNGGTIDGARVLLMNEDYVKLAETPSGAAGEFVFKNVKPALYFVQAKKPVCHIAQSHVMLKPGVDERVYLVAPFARGYDPVTIMADRVEGAALLPSMPAPARAGGKIEGHRRLSGKFPPFPESARKRGAHGRIALLARVLPDGTVGDIITLESADGELEDISRDALETWRFAPMKLDGIPVACDNLAVFDFKYR
jgi:TonB family protein